MTRIRVECIAMSVDGFAAGPDQSLENPLGVGGTGLHGWTFATRSFRRMHLPNTPAGADEGGIGVDDRYIARGFEGVGAWILGRHMFGPVRGPWGQPEWRGWWGEEPPYHVPCFVLTHHERAPLVMQGGTTFHFVTGGLDEALARSRAAAAGRDVRIGGGMATIRQALQARAVDSLHVAVAPVVLGGGEPLLSGLDLDALGYRMTKVESGEGALHLSFGRA